MAITIPFFWWTQINYQGTTKRMTTKRSLKTSDERSKEKFPHTKDEEESEKEWVEGHFGNFQISVIDSGIGISEEQRNKLFVPFYQGEITNSYQRKYGGTGLLFPLIPLLLLEMYCNCSFSFSMWPSGLGLAICRSIIELMKGSISVQSKVGSGSTFCVEFSLPLLSGNVYLRL